MSTYVLEHHREAERLERQSSTAQCAYQQELNHFHLTPYTTVLDAGCGSGVVARYLAAQDATVRVIGCDFSESRVQQARQLAQGIPNVTFQVDDLAASRCASQTFDAIICRYVLEHLEKPVLQQSLAEFWRLLKPDGLLYIIDMDGIFLNIYPQSPFMAATHQQLASLPVLDVTIGRKIPSLLVAGGFTQVDWEIETNVCKDEVMQTEIGLMRERLQHFMPCLTHCTGSAALAQRYCDEYLHTMARPGTVLFYNKFIVTGRKPATAAPLRAHGRA
ncbi:MAG: class I SAM-dependent methyltransferase [Candidatus Tectimicrobiota bacterium]